jgi:hypothetical protein
MPAGRRTWSGCSRMPKATQTTGDATGRSKALSESSRPTESDSASQRMQAAASVRATRETSRLLHPSESSKLVHPSHRNSSIRVTETRPSESSKLVHPSHRNSSIRVIETRPSESSKLVHPSHQNSSIRVIETRPSESSKLVHPSHRDSSRSRSRAPGPAYRCPCRRSHIGAFSPDRASAPPCRRTQ